MDGFADIYTIIFLAIAVVIFLRLRSVLGRRTGSERPPFDPFARRDALRPPPDKVIALPPRPGSPAEQGTPPKAEAPADAELRITSVAPAGSALAESLKRVMAADRTFDPQAFLDGAKVAYEMVVTAFAEGDRRNLKNLLSRDVYEGFEAAISERERRGETAETRFVSIDQAEIVGAEMRGRSAQVTVRFVSKLVSVTRDRTGAVIEGNAEGVTDVTDVWTFARDVSSRDPNWKLVATEAGQ